MITEALQGVWRQCTQFVQSVAPWVQGIGWQGAGSAGDAGNWAQLAARRGYAVTSSPTVGDVASWAPGAGGSGSVGHVGLVVGADRQGNPVVAESNWGSAGPELRSLTPAQAASARFIAPPPGAVETLPGPAARTAQPLDFTVGGAVSGIGNVLGTGAGILGGAAGGIAGGVAGAAGTLAGETASGWVGGFWHGLSGITGQSVTPWFRRNSVALVTAAVIWFIITSKPGQSPSSPAVVVEEGEQPQQPVRAPAAAPEAPEAGGAAETAAEAA